MQTDLLRREVRLLLLALGFLTRLPVPSQADFKASDLDGAARYFPAVGLVVAGLCALVYWLALALFEQAALALLLSMAASLLITGAFHEDGFADSCDGFGGGWRAEDVLRIMRDSRLGTYGVAGLLMILALKFAALQSLHSPLALISALFWGHVLSRWLAVSLLLDMAYVGGEGKAKPLATRLSPRHFALASLALLPLFLLPFTPVWLLLPALLLLRWWAARYLQKRLQGYTGDCLGAVQQVAEIVVYLCFLL